MKTKQLYITLIMTGIITMSGALAEHTCSVYIVPGSAIAICGTTIYLCLDETGYASAAFVAEPSDDFDWSKRECPINRSTYWTLDPTDDYAFIQPQEGSATTFYSYNVPGTFTLTVNTLTEDCENGPCAAFDSATIVVLASCNDNASLTVAPHNLGPAPGTCVNPADHWAYTSSPCDATISYEFTPCLRNGIWCVRMEEAEVLYQQNVQCKPGLQEISSADDPFITEGNYNAVVLDMLSGVDPKIICPRNCVQAHEDAHVSQLVSMSNEIWPLYEAQLEELSIPFSCTLLTPELARDALDESVNVLYSQFAELAYTVWAQADTDGGHGADDPAMIAGQECYQSLISAIIARAMAEHWSPF